MMRDACSVQLVACPLPGFFQIRAPYGRRGLLPSEQGRIPPTVAAVAGLIKTADLHDDGNAQDPEGQCAESNSAMAHKGVKSAVSSPFQRQMDNGGKRVKNPTVGPWPPNDLTNLPDSELRRGRDSYAAESPTWLSDGPKNNAFYALLQDHRWQTSPSSGTARNQKTNFQVRRWFCSLPFLMSPRPTTRFIVKRSSASTTSYNWRAYAGMSWWADGLDFAELAISPHSAHRAGRYGLRGTWKFSAQSEPYGFGDAWRFSTYRAGRHGLLLVTTFILDPAPLCWRVGGLGVLGHLLRDG